MKVKIKAKKVVIESTLLEDVEYELEATATEIVHVLKALIKAFFKGRRK